jgi:bacteriorhodopsin
MLFNRARADFLRVFVYCFLDVCFFLFFVCFLFVEYFNTKKRIDNACNKDTATVMHDDDFYLANGSGLTGTTETTK